MGSNALPVVLLVDDNPRVLTALQRALRRHPLEIQSACTSAEARKLLNGRPPAVVVSDIQRPGEDGRELLRELKARYPQMACVVHTADERITLSGLDGVHLVFKAEDPVLLPALIARLAGLSHDG